LNVSINSLKTLGKLETAEILVRQTLDKLGPIKIDLIRTDPDWQKWNFEKVLEELRGYTIRNPEENKSKGDSRNRFQHHQDNRVRGLHTMNKDEKKINCVYCNGVNHRSSEFNKVISINARTS
jgi:hypothetical protein